MSDEGESQPADELSDSAHKEPSLGPACLVVAILALAVFFSVCAFGSWLVFADQFPLAEKAINQQLIPWVEISQLSASDKASIIEQLNDLLPILRERQIDKRQLLRLRNCLTDNPILFWGGVESVVAQAQDLDMSETELDALQRVTQRLMRMATTRQLGRNDLEFALQHCSRIRSDQASFEVLDDLNADQIREFMRRGEQIADENQVPNEPYVKTPAEAFAILIELALKAQ